MSYPESLLKLSERAIRLYMEKADDRLFYHNLAHTGRVLESAGKINDHIGLDEKNYFIVYAALWLHDLEMISSEWNHHHHHHHHRMEWNGMEWNGMESSNGIIEWKWNGMEWNGMEWNGMYAALWLHDLEMISSDNGEIRHTHQTDRILNELGIHDADRQEIKDCILAAAGSRVSVTLNEKIVCDALSFYMGSPYFPEYNQLRRKETEAMTNVKIRGSIWRSRSISLLEKHQFQTPFSQDLLNKTKQENLKALISRPAGKQTNELPHIGNHPVIHPPGWKYKSKHHLSGVETVFRNSSSNHLNLSVMADNKAFIMISVNSILISLGIGLIIGKFVLIPKLFIPTVLLLFVNVFTIIYSVLATRPGLMKGKFTMEQVQNKKVDLLFFGNFFKMPLVDFEYGMKQMMDDSDFLYDNLIRDIYAQGQILGRKFRLLRSSYNIFMYGTASTVVAYIISFFL